MPTKQVIVVRSDLHLNPGKLATQVAHASMRWLTERLRADGGFISNNVAGFQSLPQEWISTPVFTTEERNWIEGSFTKIVLAVQSEDGLLAIETASIEAKLTCERIEESSLGGVLTCIAIGPHEADLIDPITGHLDVY